MNIEFVKWPKIPRLNREIIITEKIDGTNAQVYIMPVNRPSDQMREDFHANGWKMYDIADGFTLAVIPGSRNKHITIKKDNFGFAKWVNDNADDLITLGIGRHYGEWWGKGIQRNYGLDTRRFSLFNVQRYTEDGADGTISIPKCCGVVPLLYAGPFGTDFIENVCESLRRCGSVAASGFMSPEGVVVFHTAANQTFKVLLENDHIPKGKVE